MILASISRVKHHAVPARLMDFLLNASVFIDDRVADAMIDMTEGVATPEHEGQIAQFAWWVRHMHRERRAERCRNFQRAGQRTDAELLHQFRSAADLQPFDDVGVFTEKIS